MQRFRPQFGKLPPASLTQVGRLFKRAHFGQAKEGAVTNLAGTLQLLVSLWLWPWRAGHCSGRLKNWTPIKGQVSRMALRLPSTARVRLVHF
jgi:hypothetical protein